MLGLEDIWLISPQAYFRMERGRKTIVTMDITERIFKYGNKLLVRYDAEKNIPLLDSFHHDYVTECFGRLYKYVTDPKKKNFSR